ncbi:sugar ABC transporter ATP-binding protein [Paraburkholderia susongensis]|uniref:Monosaccharide ABC transporter ATP-binding protein, CUT2 family n=1 Tax=Paraburkholderia susongensis TaxID=1515439 RepID=A0A1X7M3F9_9BURK|nr:sugar ABC transporter ATP-binding protein [Paraburkholderia susongensis]SMG60520.1 monosaccharide ABC transporter ATP-binding protein, CUT2 family [Paraburkholderia susongensis]
MNNANNPPLLEIRNVSKSFGRFRALKGVSLSVNAGEIHSLMGENGAGKSTLMKILAGAHRPDEGSEILIDGRPVTIDGPMAAKALGIAIIYQELALAPNLTVAENIYLGREPSRGALIDRDAMAAGVGTVLQRLGASFTAHCKVAALSIAERQLVEIARALHARSRLLIMDEPTTTLSERETERLFELVRQLRQEGLAIVYISHRMKEVYELSDRVSVLRDGAYAGTLEHGAITPDAVVSMMVGRDLSSFYKKVHDAHRSQGRAILSVRGVTDGRRIHPCSFDIREGEVLGIAGLVGAGRTELARLIYGADPRTGGTISVDGREADIRSPLSAINAGIAYLTEDRKLLGLMLDMSVSENLNLGVIARDARAGGFLNLRKARRRTASAIEATGIRAASPAVPVGGLSGGNQQKVLLSRLLETQPRVLILDEPTRGVDIGAKSEIYRLIDRLARDGVGVAVISSELPEIVGICDRVLVMREGAIAGEVGGAAGSGQITQENIMAIATSAVPDAA